MLTLLIALALDLALGDPPSRWHPVAWVGRALDAGRRRLAGRPPRRLLVGGAVLVTSVAVGAAGVTLTLERVAAPWPLAALLVDAVLLKGALSVRGLFAAVSGVRHSLEAGRLEAARAALGRDLVSRPVESLDAGHVASGAMESLAENPTDSLVAPVLFFLLGGMPGAWTYRVVNTADAMLGYREGEFEHLDKAAAPAGRCAELGARAARRRGPGGGRGAGRRLRHHGVASPPARRGIRRAPTRCARWRPWPAGSACGS